MPIFPTSQITCARHEFDRAAQRRSGSHDAKQRDRAIAFCFGVRSQPTATSVICMSTAQTTLSWPCGCVNDAHPELHSSVLRQACSWNERRASLTTAHRMESSNPWRDWSAQRPNRACRSRRLDEESLHSFRCSRAGTFVFAGRRIPVRLRHRGDAENRTSTTANSIRAFQTMDRVIQNNQPAVCHRLGGIMLTLEPPLSLQSGGSRIKFVVNHYGCVLVPFLGVQLPTVRINVPLNNALQKLDAAGMDDWSKARPQRFRASLEPVERNQDGLLCLHIVIVAARRRVNRTLDYAFVSRSPPE